MWRKRIPNQKVDIMDIIGSKNTGSRKEKCSLYVLSVYVYIMYIEKGAKMNNENKVGRFYRFPEKKSYTYDELYVMTREEHADVLWDIHLDNDLRDLSQQEATEYYMENGVNRFGPYSNISDYEYFVENVNRTKPFRVAALMMEHLLKLGYADTTNWEYLRLSMIWQNHFHGHRRDMGLIEKKSGANWENIVDQMKNNIDDIYERAKAIYIMKANKYKDDNDILSRGIPLLPKDCPWTIKELLNDYITILLRKLPNLQKGVIM